MRTVSLLAALLPALAAGAGAQMLSSPARFHVLRFEEDWSSLQDPETKTAYWWPWLKQRPLDDAGDWRLDLGGQARVRAQREKNRTLTGSSPQTNDFALTRMRLNASLEHESGFRTYVEVLDARIHGNDRPATPIDIQNVDLHNGFLEYGSGQALVRAGRMELMYGGQRFVSPLDWSNTRRRFEGLLGRHATDDTRVDTFVTKEVPVDPRGTDSKDNSRWFSGVYATFTGDEGGGLDVYGLAQNETADVAVSESGRVATSDTYTTGVRGWGKRGALDWEGEAAYQFGQFAGDDIDAASLSAQVGVTGEEMLWKPRLGLIVDWASGDSDPTDGRHETFNQLYPLGHAWLGIVDLVGRQNLVAIQPNLRLQLDEGTRLDFQQHFFHLEDRRDALYGVSGAPTFRDPTGGSGTDVGREFDVILTHQMESLGPHGWIQFGWAQFTPGDFVKANGSRKHASLLYGQMAFTF